MCAIAPVARRAPAAGAISWAMRAAATRSFWPRSRRLREQRMDADQPLLSLRSCWKGSVYRSRNSSSPRFIVAGWIALPWRRWPRSCSRRRTQAMKSRLALSRGAEELAAAVFAAARQLNLDSAPLPLALAGGVLLASRSYQEQMRTALAQRGLVAEPITLVHEPAEGALRLATELVRGLSTTAR